MWYMHDGAPAHFGRAVRDVLCNTYRDRWIGTGGSSAWSPRSPDLNPLHFYVFVYLETCVYAALIGNENALHHRIMDYLQVPRHL
jgi:hypothetical protein